VINVCISSGWIIDEVEKWYLLHCVCVPYSAINTSSSIIILMKTRLAPICLNSSIDFLKLKQGDDN
jgi:hypothetical protein